MGASKYKYNYAGKRVVVTGGASGVGAALVELLDDLGQPEVIVLDINEPATLAPSQRFIQTDLADPAALDRAVVEVGQVDVLFNNAAVAGTAPPKVVLGVNVLALRHLSNAIAANMSSGGAVVNTSSNAGLQWTAREAEIDELLKLDWDDALEWFDQRHETLGIDTYSFSKECVQRLTWLLAPSFVARGLRINTVCPSPIDTPLLKDFRETFTDTIIDFAIGVSEGLATPADIAEVLAFLGMDASRHVNGVNLLADRGANAALSTGQVDFTELLEKLGSSEGE